MRSISLADLLAGIVTPPASLAGKAVAGLTLDSRAVVADGVFVAVAGLRSHGALHADAARAAGAACILAEAPLPEGVVVADDLLVVPELRVHLAALAQRAFGDAARTLDVIGVTGTNGKTSTVQLLAQALVDTPLGPCGHVGTLGIGLGGWTRAGERTTPDVIAVHAALNELQARGAKSVAMEVSSHALDQGRIDGVKFRLAVFTNLTRDHLDYHPDMRHYGEAKARLFLQHAPAAAVINIDDAFGVELAAACGPHVELWTCSASADSAARIRAEAVELDGRGIRFRLCEGDRRVEVRSALLGRFNVDNLLAVAASLRALGVPLAETAARLTGLRPVRGRMNRLAADHGALVVVDYAHTPDALEKALQTLRAHTAGRLICVFGCGGDRDRGKRPQMGAIAEALADVLLVTDDNPRSENGDAIVAEVVAGMRNPAAMRVQRDRRAAIAEAIGMAVAGDTVLIAGKGHEPYQEVQGVRYPFDDAEVALAVLGERAA